MEIPLQIRNGQSMPYHFFGKLNSKNGNKQIVGLAVSLPRQQVTKKRVLNLQNFYQNTIDNTDAIVYVKDRKGRYQFVNQAFCRVFGREQKQVIGNKDRDLIDDTCHSQIKKGDRKVFRSMESVRQKEELIINGKKRYFMSLKTPIKSLNGRETWLCGISPEITKQVEMEHELKEALKEREVLIKEVHHRVKNNLAIINAFIEMQLIRCGEERNRGGAAQLH